MNVKSTFRTLAVAALPLILAACTPDGQDGKGVHIEGAWARATPPGANVSGGFLTIHNASGRDERLVSVNSSAVDRVEIHEARHENGMMKMRPLPAGLPLPAGSTVELRPGGFHLMLIQPKQSFAEGDVIAATLRFEQAGDIEVTFAVKAVGAIAGGGPHPAH